LSFSPTFRRIDAQIRAAQTGSQLRKILNSAKQVARDAIRDAGHSDTVSQALALKLINASLSRVEFSARRIDIASRPFGLELDPCNACTLACPGCVHSRRDLFDWPNGMLSPDRMADFLRRYGPYAVQALFCNYGEPLLNPKTPEYIRSAKRYLVQTTISTSLSIQHFDADAYVQSGLDYMIVSIDGATQPTYERFRKNGNIELVSDNLRRLIAARDRAESQFPVIAWQFLAFEHNRHEIPAAIELATELGLNEIRISEPFDVTWDDPSIRPAAHVPGQIIQLQPIYPEDYSANWNPFLDELESESIQQVFDEAWPIHSNGPLTRPSHGHTCHWLYMNTIIDAKGRILPCCSAPAPDFNLTFGHLDPASPTPDLFNTPLHHQARTHFANGLDQVGGPHCQKCEWTEAQRQPDIDPTHLGQYAAAIFPEVLDSETRNWLSDWSTKSAENSVQAGSR